MKDSEESFSLRLKQNKQEIEKMHQIIGMIWPFINYHLKSEAQFDTISNIKKLSKNENKIHFYDSLMTVIQAAVQTTERKGVDILSPEKVSLSPD